MIGVGVIFLRLYGIWFYLKVIYFLYNWSFLDFVFLVGFIFVSIWVCDLGFVFICICVYGCMSVWLCIIKCMCFRVFSSINILSCVSLILRIDILEWDLMKIFISINLFEKCEVKKYFCFINFVLYD